MKRGKVCLALLLAASVFVSCGNGGERNPEESARKEDTIQIGMSFDSFVIERWQRDRDVFVSTARELGAQVNVQSASGDTAEQISQIEYFIEKKMDVIVIICVDSNALSDVVKKAKDAGIKVIAYDRLIKNGNVDLYISFDNEAVGRMMGEALVKEGMSGKKVLMLCGPTADNNVSLVEKGFRRVMNENNISVVDTFYADGWKAELASSYIYENVDKVNRADAVMCGNDDIATQVVRALAEKRLAGKMGVVGQDADLAACQRIVEGTQIMTVYKPVERLAQRAAEYAILLAKGEDLGKVDTIYDDSANVPYVTLEPISVNKRNMDEVIIDSGFHLKEDVYLNVPEAE